MIVGTGEYRYRRAEGWGNSIQGYKLPGMVSCVAVDAHDNVHAFCRVPFENPAMRIFDCEGNFIKAWGSGTFTDTHGVCVDARGNVYVTDRKDHTLRKYTNDGELLMHLGTPHQTGAPGQPFNGPTKAVCSPDGDIFVADGYGQYRIHRFSPAGELLYSWGEKGDGPGQFALPHSICLDHRQRVLVADRYNNRISLFSYDGEHLDDWPVELPNDVVIDQDGVAYVAEHPCAICSEDGELLTRWRDRRTHSIAVDSQGSIYVTSGHSAEEAMLEKYTRL